MLGQQFEGGGYEQAKLIRQASDVVGFGSLDSGGERNVGQH